MEPGGKEIVTKVILSSSEPFYASLKLFISSLHTLSLHGSLLSD
jgi:hypothetical protein